MVEINSMDILNAPSHEEIIVAKIVKWVKSAYDDENHVSTFIFKKDTPQKILNLFQKNTNLFLFKVNPKYEIES
ncbi:hypothetical protein GCM10022297_14990 [Lactobacillus hamsteri]|uniref:Uncharacterized protein n=1 Tax=Lactobacillus hamsteri DSM 5661 = JCM 6256 TaxID=1423754 RepID=A0A0R1YCV3_9LACO|nr:hypothetical protein [Lactobacillus hamsteri]KRM40127.1 hypothetical protein FC39_GL000864 [Lactobacillus hamsteri DSM 5661 = JCM 6256]